MPTYEYVCGTCNHDFEVFQSIKDDPVKTCPACGMKVTRKISAGAGLLFKGSGFYITDYRSEEYKKAAQKDTPSEVKSDSVKKPESTSTDKDKVKT